jgi:hypothetical protein
VLCVLTLQGAVHCNLTLQRPGHVVRHGDKSLPFAGIRRLAVGQAAHFCAAPVAYLLSVPLNELLNACRFPHEQSA